MQIGILLIFGVSNNGSYRRSGYPLQLLWGGIQNRQRYASIPGSVTPVFGVLETEIPVNMYAIGVKEGKKAKSDKAVSMSLSDLPDEGSLYCLPFIFFKVCRCTFCIDLN